ncbi:hypothetical protein [Vulgatibacter incomptus]|uniref:Lipoprotein n=1 Tax=Vulgatibacter incomptus TaxID=1391653 RepID=A0A0K1PAB3_9BACT|nr:hypothetical protein [Vulgatibacter incomptus]AKU90442.1 hypothetical protein AKJ08_0829 [Vulgatibacter incomptus]
MRSTRFVAAAILLAGFVMAGCASHTAIPDEDRVRLERALPGRTFYLRHSMYVGPFWSDRQKLFVTDVVPGEIPWVVNPAGVPMEPGEPTGVIPAGTRVRLSKLELPTGFTVATRDPFLPRYNPWVFLEVDGMPRSPAAVMVLRSDLKSFAQVQAELDRYLSVDDLAPMLSKLPQDLLRAVKEKRLVEGMSADLVAASWGWPEQRRLSPSPEGRREEWIWPSERRKAVIVGDRLVSWEGKGAATSVAE